MCSHVLSKCVEILQYIEWLLRLFWFVYPEKSDNYCTQCEIQFKFVRIFLKISPICIVRIYDEQIALSIVNFTMH